VTSRDQSRQTILILATLCVTYFVENFIRSSASSLSPILIAELGISLGEMGLLITAFFLIYGILQLPAGLLSSTFGPRKTILWFTVLTCAGSLLFWFSHRYELLFLAQFIMGVGESVFYINAVAIVTRWWPPEKKATAIGVLSASSGIGGFLCYMGFPLAQTYLGDWRLLYLVVVIILFLNYGTNYLLIRDYPPDAVQHEAERPKIVESIKEVLSNKRFRVIIAIYALMIFNGILNNWINPFLMKTKGLTYVEAGFVSSFGTVAGFLGCIAMGVISDRLRSRRKPIVLFTTLNTFLFAAMIFIPGQLPFLAYAAVWCGMCLCGSIWVLYWSIGSEILPPGKASIGLGMMNGMSVILSSLLAPVYGSLVDVTGSYFTPNIIALGLSLGTVLIIFILIKETYGETPWKSAPS
jgi:predicted MFS family arabinose efflux permease